MSVLVPVIDTIDGPSRRIYLLQGVSAFHWIEDIYREYIDRRANNEDLRKFFPLLRQAGNDPKGGGKYTPRYVTMINGTRVVPFDENILIVATGEAITDNADVDPDPFDTTTRTQPLKLYITPPASELVKAADELVAIQRMAFDEVITVNPLIGVTGTEWPTGTLGRPVNNLADALIISAVNDIGTMSIVSDMLIDSGGDYRGMTFIGSSKTKTTMTVSEAAQVDNCEFYEAHVTGTLDGDSTLNGCVIDDLNYVTGYIEQCVLNSGTIQLGSGATAHFLDCWSGVPGILTPTIDMGGSGQALAMRNYNGGIRLTNKSGPESVSIDLNSGQVKIDLTTVTNGTIVVRGLGKVTEATTGDDLQTGYYGTLYLLNEAINRENISSAVWDEPIADHLVTGSTGRSMGVQQFDGAVHVSVTGSPGTEFPIGTERYPVNNETDAIAIAQSNGLDTFHMLSDFTITGGSFSNFTISGRGRNGTTLTVVGTEMLAVVFDSIRVTGTFADTSVCGFKNCTISDVYGISLTADSCVIDGVLSLTNTGDSNLYDCFDAVPGIGVPDIKVNDCTYLGIWDWSGGIRLSDITADSAISLMISAGRLCVDETCVGGNIIVKGMADMLGTTGGTVVDSDGLVTQSAITDSVWSYERP